MKPRGRVWKSIKWTGAVAIVLLLVVWISNCWYRGHVYTNSMLLGASEGRLRIGWEEWAIYPHFLEGGIYKYPALSERSFEWWFDWDRMDYQRFARTTIDIPLWFLILLTAVPTALMFRSDRRRRRIEAQHLCAKCGYSKTGLPANHTCPECGNASSLTPNP